MSPEPVGVGLVLCGEADKVRNKLVEIIVKRNYISIVGLNAIIWISIKKAGGL